MGTLSIEATLPFLFFHPFYIGVNSQRKEFNIWGANSFLEEQTSYMEGKSLPICKKKWKNMVYSGEEQI